MTDTSDSDSTTVTSTSLESEQARSSRKQNRRQNSKAAKDDALLSRTLNSASRIVINKKKPRKRIVTICLVNCRYDVIRRVASKFGYREVGETDNWNLYWTDWSISIERCKDMKRFQKINHFPGMLEICRKDLLARNLNRMQRLFPKDYNFFPKTWCLPADLGDALAYSRLRKNKTYILKPDAGSQGRGILITKNLKEIRPTDRYICQVYLSRPFLIDGYKFDLRVYTLITSCDPLRIYIYKEGLVRFATSRYKEPSGVNISNVFMHLTNYAVNKHSRTYNQDTEAGSKRKLTWFNRYMKNLGYDIEKLWRLIDEVIIKTVICSYPILRHSYSACFPSHDVIPACTELLGTDIILDSKLNPQLLEVNHSPSFHTDTELDCEIKESLISDMFSMMNLANCDKRRILRDDKKRIRNRLLQGINKDCLMPTVLEERNFTSYYQHELNHRGGFRLVYPSTDRSYEKLFNQGNSSLFCDTAASRARETAQSAMRDELLQKAKLEAEKRITTLRPPVKARTETRVFRVPTAPKNSFEPQMIVEAEEKDRVSKLSQRDFLVKNNRLLEYIYFSMRMNGVLRPQDEKKYAIFDKIDREIQDVDTGDSPAISDLMDGIRYGTDNNR